jgi:hypothetical protein
VESNRNLRVGLLITLIASVLVVIGAVAVAVSQEQTGTVMGGGMSVGQTATTTTPPAVLPTSVASPTMKAPRPKGF